MILTLQLDPFTLQNGQEMASDGTVTFFSAREMLPLPSAPEIE
jgi:hypothetical protein